MEYTIARLSLCCTCSAHVSWLVYLIHDCGCCDVRGKTSIKSKKLVNLVGSWGFSWEMEIYSNSVIDIIKFYVA